MKIALIVTSEFDDYKLLEMKLDELKVKEVIAGTSNSYKMLQQYIEKRPNIKITQADGNTSHVSIAYMLLMKLKMLSSLQIDGKRTELSIANTLNENKNLNIYSYKSKAFRIEQQDEYLKISFSGNLQKATNIDSINLNKEQVEKLINRLTELKNNL